MRGINLPESVWGKKHTHLFEDDFDGLVTDLYTSGGTGATIAVSDAANGVLSIGSGATLNDEAFHYLTKQTLLFAKDKSILFRARASFVEGNTDDMAFFLGFTDQAGADLIQDGGAAVKAGDLDGVGFLSFLDETQIRCYSSANANKSNISLDTADKNNLTGTLQAYGANDKWFEIEVIPVSLTEHQIIFRIDDEVVAHVRALDVSNPTEMNLIAYVKSPSANAQAILLDYWMVAQTR